MMAVSVIDGQYMWFVCVVILGGRILIGSKERLSVRRTEAVYVFCGLAKVVLVLLVGGYTLILKTCSCLL